MDSSLGAPAALDIPANCYEVWLKHPTLLWENQLQAIPNTVAELGPGDSLGVGLAALLSGASKFYVLDVVLFANQTRNPARSLRSWSSYSSIEPQDPAEVLEKSDWE